MKTKLYSVQVDDQLAREQMNLLEIVNKLEAGLGQVINYKNPCLKLNCNVRDGGEDCNSYRQKTKSWAWT